MKLIKIIFALILVSGLAHAPCDAKKDKQKDLPPGLQKKIERGGELPPGWQKKLKPGGILDREIFERGVIVTPEDKDGVVTIKVENKTIRLIRATMEILDILDL